MTFIIFEKNYLNDYKFKISAMNQSVALPNPAVEGVSMTFLFYPELYDDYFYHSDHLGSSNYISNNTGIVSQHTEYLPFGETFVDEHLNSHNTPFKFNAKELDDETGNYYYGARYYNPKWSTWLSVDPLAEDAPDWTPYRYGFHNPLRFTDPTGMSETEDHWEIDNKGNAKLIDTEGDEIYVNDVLISDFKFDTNEKLKGLTQILSHYYNENKSGSKLYNNLISVLSFDNNYKYVSSSNWDLESKPFKNKSAPLAFAHSKQQFKSKSHRIVVPLSNYKLPFSLRTKWNLRNIFIHEETHLRQRTDIYDYATYLTYHELEAYSTQMKHSTWNKTTSDFQAYMLKNVDDYLPNLNVVDPATQKVFQTYTKFFNTKRQ